jgi:putative endonuclease
VPPQFCPKFKCGEIVKLANRTDKFFVYIVQCKNSTYYTGYTQNLNQRIEEHNSGRGAEYLKGKLPVRLVYAKEYRYYKNALLAERRLKKLTRNQKLKLIEIYANNADQLETI